LVRSPKKLGELAGELDGVVEGEITRPETLEGCCDSIDVVFSSVGITRQKDGRTFRDVDYRGNLNLLNVARRAGVKKFVYVSVLDGPRLMHLDIVRAHEEFVAEVKESGIAYAIVRPTGYFSDLGEIYQMARRGRVWLIGDGHHRVNPIHGSDLAVACADAIAGTKTEIDVGGPQVLTWKEIAELAFRVQGKAPRITTVPTWPLSPLLGLTRLFSRHKAGLLEFFVTMATRDVVGPPTGVRTLEQQFRQLGVAP
jgi:uncharacterized protein YbjT (DUF2867 family)